MVQVNNLFGRRVIYTDADEITDENIVDELNKVLAVHSFNRAEIDYLYNYYKGNQPILTRKKEVRPEINNKVVVNRANEIVSFRVGYLVGSPIQYVSIDENDINPEINRFNKFLLDENKAEKDKQLVTWSEICGTSYRIALPVSDREEDEAPFEIYTLDPRSSFVVYHSGLGNKPMMAGITLTHDNGSTRHCVYTPSVYYEILDGLIVKREEHFLGDIPIIEYPANSARLGAFEIVIGLLDAINTVESNRIDGIEQFVQALLVLKGVNLEGEEYNSLRENGGLSIPLDADAKYLVQELNQTETQKLIDDMYSTVLTICGMPNRNGGSSTSDTGAAVIMRDGWENAEARAKDAESIFKQSDRQFLKLIVRYTNFICNMKLRASSIDPRFTRKYYGNTLEKVQVLTLMLNNDKIHPRLAFEHSGMFADPEFAYTLSKEYREKHIAEQLKELTELSKKRATDTRTVIEAGQADV